MKTPHTIGAVVSVAFIFLAVVPTYAAGCALEEGEVGLDSVATGTIRGFEIGEGEFEGHTGIYFDEPCEFFIDWENALPGVAKKGAGSGRSGITVFRRSSWPTRFLVSSDPGATARGVGYGRNPSNTLAVS